MMAILQWFCKNALQLYKIKNDIKKARKQLVEKYR